MARDSRLAALAGLAAIGLVARRSGPPILRPRSMSRRQRAARGTSLGSALLALAALSDSGIEHYRGSFNNKAMYAPLIVSTMTLAASLRDALKPSTANGKATDVVDGLALATGAAGTGFHLYNITKRPGGFSWLNLFYAAPLGAPAALSLAGLLRRMGRALRGSTRNFCGVPLVKGVAWLLSFGLIGTSAEAALLHFRGAYHNPAMLAPVTLPPVGAALLGRAALLPGQPHPVTRWSLRALAAMGLLGAAFHAYGVQRNMGGWRNWSQNLLNGPPLPAPPSFTALAIAGLAVLDLIERGER